MQRLTLALGAVLLVLASGPLVQAQNTSTNVIDALRGANFTGLVTLIDSLGLTSALSDPELAVSIFAPSNQALTDLAASAAAIGLPFSSVAPAIVNYHVATTTPVAFADNGILQTRLSTLNLPNTTSSIVIRTYNGSVWYLGSIIYGATVNASNVIPAGKSNVYPIDSVLIPPSGLLNVSLTIDAYLAGGNFSTLRALIAAEPSIASVTSNPLSAVTLIAPTDAAFANLLNATNTTAASLIGSPLARRILQNHVFPGYPLTTYDFSVQNATNITTASTFAGDTVTVYTEQEGDIFFYSFQGRGNDFRQYLVTLDAAAGMSSIQVLDGVILPNTTASNATTPGGRRLHRLARKL